RRRHTRFSRDWSSDVCSSDLHGAGSGWPPAKAEGAFRSRRNDRAPAITCDQSLEPEGLSTVSATTAGLAQSLSRGRQRNPDKPHICGILAKIWKYFRDRIPARSLIRTYQLIPNAGNWTMREKSR